MYIIPIDFATPEYDETVRLRDKILRAPLGLTFTPEDLGDEYLCFHLAAYNNNHQLLACLVLSPLNAKEIKMRQVAVDDPVQKKGIGTQLVKASEVFSKNKGFEEMQLNAREAAVSFYLRLDYETIGEQFEEVGIPHFAMRKKL